MSPKNAIAPMLLGVLLGGLVVAHRRVGDDLARWPAPRPRSSCSRRHRFVVAEVEPQPVGRRRASPPACTCGPSTSRSAQCRTCVAVWLRRIGRGARRRSRRRPRRPRRARPRSTSPGAGPATRAGRTACRATRTPRAAVARRDACRCRRPGHRTRRRTACGRGRRRPLRPHPPGRGARRRRSAPSTFAPVGLVLLAAGEVGGTELVEQLAVQLDRRAVALPPAALCASCGRASLLRHAARGSRRGRRGGRAPRRSRA